MAQLHRRRLGQTTVEYVLLTACVALPLAIVFFRTTTAFFARVITDIVTRFTGMY